MLCYRTFRASLLPKTNFTSSNVLLFSPTPRRIPKNQDGPYMSLDFQIKHLIIDGFALLRFSESYHDHPMELRSPLALGHCIQNPQEIPI